ncbi:aminopeptidase [Pterulicium gracile]|uniref:Peptide hydrolase n=1 Tax=Pterulicium gracile TaxID=1884261 RepID=A0A5C3QQT9_9AGAR|nr:aminopeptidase [Pterula gracilis]
MKLTIGFVLAAFLAFTQAIPVSKSEIQEKAVQGLRLLQFEEHLDPVWKTEDERLDYIRKNVNFFDVTETWELEQSLPQTQGLTALATYAPPSHQTAVNALLPKLSTTSMSSYLASLTAFNNRYYTSSTGQQASVYIQDTLRAIASAAGRSDITVTAFKHSWAQTSTIVRIAGTSSDQAVTILGAHMDSINSSSPSSGRAPGADDDGSGTVNLMEVFKVLVQSGFKPSTPLEFMFYAAEEVGLLGSQAIATSYKSSGKSVKAVLQLDMTGYQRPGTTEVIGIMPDFVDAGLTTFLRQLITSYSRLQAVTNSACGYACSDHASWNRQGFPTALPFEGSYPSNSNPVIHSSSDTISASGFSITHSLEFAKVALGFAYELTV